jgi:hypothetical protein
MQMFQISFPLDSQDWGARFFPDVCNVYHFIVLLRKDYNKLMYFEDYKTVSKYIFIQKSVISERELLCVKVSRLHPPVLLV